MDDDTANYARVMLLLLDGGHQLCLGFLKHHHPQINEHLAKEEIYRKGKDLLDQGRISDNQMNQFYPPTDLGQWDFGLTSQFLVHCTDITSNERETIQTLQAKRREIAEKFPLMKITNAEFTVVWESVVCVLEKGEALLAKGEALLANQSSRTGVDKTIQNTEQLQVTPGHLDKVKTWEETENMLDDKVTHGDDVNTENLHIKYAMVHDAAYYGKLHTLKYMSKTDPARLRELDDEGNQCIHFAAAGGQIQCLQYLIKKGQDPYTKNTEYGNTILFKAIESRNLDIVQYICRHYSQLVFEPCSSKGWLPITSALHAGESITRCVVAAGADITWRDYFNRTVFHHAGYYGSADFIRVVCEEYKDKRVIEELKEAQDKDGWSACHSAVSSGQIECLKTLVENGFSPYAKSTKGFTILDVAARSGYINALSYICETFPSLIKETSNAEENVLQSAAQGRSLECFKCLIELQDPRLTSQNGYTVLHDAAFWGGKEIVRYLCETHEQLKWRDYTQGDTPLHSAVRGGHLDVLKYLLHEGLDPEKANKDGFTILHVAAEGGMSDIVEHLCTKYSQLVGMKTTHGKRAIDFAIQSGKSAQGRSLECFKYLIELQDPGLQITSTDQYGSTVLHKAAFYGRKEIVRYLCETYEQLKWQDSTHGDTPLHSAVRGGHLDVLKYFLHEGLDPEKANQHGLTILHVATKGGMSDIVEHLCTKYSQLVGMKTTHGKRSIDFAIQSGNSAQGGSLECFKYLIELQDPWLTSQNGYTVLHYAAFWGRKEIVRYLCKTYEQLKWLENKYGDTPLHSAVRGGHLDVLKYLLHKGLDPEKANKHGLTILHVAAKAGMSDIVEHLCTKYSQLVGMKTTHGQRAIKFAIQSGNFDCIRLLTE